jgi:hypothetical protein
MKPLTPSEIVTLSRKECHEAFDRIWKATGTVPAYADHFRARSNGANNQRRSIMQKMRNMAYFYIADQMGIPEREVHVSALTGHAKFELFKMIARRTTASQIYVWWMSDGEKKYRTEFAETQRKAREHRNMKRRVLYQISQDQ